MYYKTVVDRDVRPLKEPRPIGRALTYEKLRLMHVAGKNEEWQRAEAAMSHALCTTMRGCEIKRLQWRDVDLLNRAILIRTSKTDAGERLIPVNDEAYEIVIGLRERAKSFNGTDSAHYVFAACENGHIDPTRNQKSFWTAWRSLTKAAGLAGMRFHDLRLHAITELAESQVSDQTIMAIAGMSARRCSLAIRTCGLKRDGKRGASSGGQKRGLRHKQRHKGECEGCTSSASD